MRPIQWFRKVNGMPVLLMREWDWSKDEEKREKRLKFQTEVMGPYFEKLVKEKGIKVETSNWSDNTGHKVILRKYETMEDFSKAWDDERWQQIWARYVYFIDNVRIRLLRPGFTVPEDFWK